MSLKVFPNGIIPLLTGAKAWGSDTVKLRLCMANTTCDTQDDKVGGSDPVEFLSDFTTIDVCDSANYGGDKTVTCNTVVKDATAHRIKFPADNLLWSSLASCTRQIEGGLLYWDGADDSARIPIAWLGFAAPKVPNGSNFPFIIPSSGAFYVTDNAGGDNEYMFLEAALQALTGVLDLVSDTIKGHLCMEDTTIGTEDPTTLAGFSDMDINDATSPSAYTPATLTSAAWLIEDDRISLTADDLLFDTLGVSTRDNVALLLFKDGADDAHRVPVMRSFATAAANGAGANYPWNWVNGSPLSIYCPRE